jgi:8-oxo-dGTP diphosphatase
MNKPIICTSLSGRRVEVGSEALSFRPSVYGLIQHDDALLVVRNAHDGRYSLPGGAVELGEPLTEALAREVAEETGIELDSARFLAFRESFFYYDLKDACYHSLLFFFAAEPLSTALVEPAAIDDLVAASAHWVPVSGLRACDFTSFGDVVMEELRR